MLRTAAALAVTLALAPAALGAPQGSPAAPVTKFIDAFNKGDAKAADATIAAGDIAIVDEFAPFQWTGPKAAQVWGADYDRNAKAEGVTDGKVTYGKPTRIETKGGLAYVILPTVYLYKSHGKPMAEEGQITAVVTAVGNSWKIKGWTWSGVTPHPSK